MDGEPWHRGRGQRAPLVRGAREVPGTLQRTEHPWAAAAARPRSLLSPKVPRKLR